MKIPDIQLNNDTTVVSTTICPAISPSPPIASAIANDATAVGEANIIYNANSSFPRYPNAILRATNASGITSKRIAVTATSRILFLTRFPNVKVPPKAMRATGVARFPSVRTDCPITDGKIMPEKLQTRPNAVPIIKGFFTIPAKIFLMLITLPL